MLDVRAEPIQLFTHLAALHYQRRLEGQPLLRDRAVTQQLQKALAQVRDQVALDLPAPPLQLRLEIGQALQLRLHRRPQVCALQLARLDDLGQRRADRRFERLAVLPLPDPHHLLDP